MLCFFQHTAKDTAVDNTAETLRRSVSIFQGKQFDMTPKGSNAELKRIIYWITAGLTSVLVSIGGYLYVKMEQRVTTIEANNQLSMEMDKRVVTLEDWVKEHDRETFSKVEEYAKSITALTVELNGLKKSLDNLSQSQNEMLKTLRTLEISDAKRNELPK